MNIAYYHAEKKLNFLLMIKVPTIQSILTPLLKTQCK